jgi:hypothetical protein
MQFKNYLKFFTLILLGLFLVSCAPSKEGQLEIAKDDAEMVEEEMITVEADSREALFVYDQQLQPAKDELILKFDDEPLLLASGYVRLVGVVSGGMPLALLEVGGRGLCAGVGEEVAEYKITQIAGKSVCLKRKGGK